MAIKIDGKLVAGRGAPGMSPYRAAQLGGYTGTEEEFYAALGNIGTAGGPELLWENASPTSQFAAQTATLDLSGYDFVCVTFLVYTGGTECVTQFFPKGKESVANFSDHNIKIRKLTVNSNGIAFDIAQALGTYGDYNSYVTANTYLIPFVIYGIKGVTTNV